jgi:arsenite-transporting ATPase
VSAADVLVGRLPRTTLVVGKGGVGKTTCAAGLALCASRKVSTLVLSTDPARALPTVLDHPLGPAPTPIPYAKMLAGEMLDAGPLRDRFLERWGAVIRTILDRGTYLDDSDIGPLVDTAFPGSDEIFAGLELARLLAPAGATPTRTAAVGPAERPTATQPKAYSRLFVDTAPTGHTLRLLNLPHTFRALVRLLDAMQNKHRFMVRTLMRTYRGDAADAFLAEMQTLVSALEQALKDPRQCAAIVVTNSQPLVLEETRRYLDALRALSVHVAAVVWNAVDDTVPSLGDAEQYAVPTLDRWPTGREGLELWLAELRSVEGGTRLRRRRVRKRVVVPSSERPRSGASHGLLRPLSIVAGKGGVGKTTVAAALAVYAAGTRRTLVVSTDPAPSLADAYAQPIPDHDTPVEGIMNLFARQMDASAAFARLRDDYQARVDALFGALVARGVDMAHDRAIARDLLSLAPPGVDEVYALSLLADALFQDNYECVVVDPAPTGHLLRLLEMPQLALAWSHQLLRLMLKYKDVAGLGETAQDVLAFARNLRALDALLHDHARSAVVIVTLDEPVVLAETARLASEVRGRGVSISGIVRNRASGERPATLPVPDAPMHFEAPAVNPAPVGPAALRRWAEAWTELTREESRLQTNDA